MCIEEKCLVFVCDYVFMFDIDNVEVCFIDGNFIRGWFFYDEFGCIILDVSFVFFDVLFLM